MSWHSQREAFHEDRHSGAPVLKSISPIRRESDPASGSAAPLTAQVARALAETYSLYLKTAGPIQINVDRLSREQCEALLPAIAAVAESIRSLGQPFPPLDAEAGDPARGRDEAAEAGDEESDSDRDGVADFTRKLRAALGIPIDPEGARRRH